MNRKLYFHLAPILAVIFIGFAFHECRAQSATPAFSFRPGQSIYVVAFRRVHPIAVDSENVPLDRQEYSDYDLDAERKVRKRIEDWTPFRVVDKPSEADFIFLVHLDENSVEGLALPYDAYRRYFKDRFDLDSLRDAAYGRYLVGPLKLSTISRLSDRLVEQFRDKVAPGHKRSGK